MEFSELPREGQMSVGGRRIALFGTGADLRLAERFPTVIDGEPALARTSATLRRRYGYLGFSARTGEIGSLKALRLVFEAVLDNAPVVAWQRGDGRFVDPLRPLVEPEGLASDEEVSQLQAQHFSAIQRVLAEADEILLVLGGGTTGRDRLTGLACATLPGSDFPLDLRDRIEPHFSDLEEMDADFTALWQRLRALRPNLRFTLALMPPVPGVSPSRGEQHQLACLRTLVDEWVWRFADVAYLPIWDRAMSQRNEAEAESWALAERLLTTEPPVAAAELESDDPDEQDDAAPTENAEAARAERRERKRLRKAGAAPSTVCEDELLEAFSK